MSRLDDRQLLTAISLRSIDRDWSGSQRAVKAKIARSRHFSMISFVAGAIGSDMLPQADLRTPSCSTSSFLVNSSSETWVLLFGSSLGGYSDFWHHDLSGILTHMDSYIYRAMRQKLLQNRDEIFVVPVS